MIPGNRPSFATAEERTVLILAEARGCCSDRFWEMREDMDDR